jgi:hypothetical protein
MIPYIFRLKVPEVFYDHFRIKQNDCDNVIRLEYVPVLHGIIYPQGFNYAVMIITITTATST